MPDVIWKQITKLVLNCFVSNSELWKTCKFLQLQIQSHDHAHCNCWCLYGYLDLPKILKILNAPQSGLDMCVLWTLSRQGVTGASSPLSNQEHPDRMADQ